MMKTKHNKNRQVTVPTGSQYIEQWEKLLGEREPREYIFPPMSKKLIEELNEAFKELATKHGVVFQQR